MKEEYPPADFTFDEVIRRLSEHFSPIRCSRCQRCVCPQGHEIHLLLRQYNYYHLGKRFWALKRIRMNIEEVSESCRRCTERLCMKDCPQKLMIPELIERIRELTM